MRHFVLTLAAVLAGGAWAAGAITIDGNIDDWGRDYIRTDATGDGMIERWGFTREGEGPRGSDWYWYFFIELDRDVSLFAQGPDNGAWAGIWFDTDHYAGTVSQDWGPWRYGYEGPGYDYGPVYQATSGLTTSTAWVPPEWQNGQHQGIDIAAKLGVNTSGWGGGWNFWGAGDVAGAQGDPVSPGGSFDSTDIAWSGRIIEARVPMSAIINEVAQYPDYVNGNFKNRRVNGLWKVAVAADGRLDGSWIALDATYAPYVFLIPDANNDGKADLGDFMRVSVNFYRPIPPPPESWEYGDFNFDGMVNLSDFVILSVNFGSDLYALASGGGSPVPEPLTLALLGLGGLLLPRRT